MSDKTPPTIQGPPEDNGLDDLFEETGTHDSNAQQPLPGFEDMAPEDILPNASARNADRLADGELRRTYLASIRGDCWINMHRLNANRYKGRMPINDIINDALESYLKAELEEYVTPRQYAARSDTDD